MNIKTFFKTAWNEPRRFFLWLGLISAVGFGFVCVAHLNSTPYGSSPRRWEPYIAISGFTFVCLAIVSLTSFLLSWIPPFHRFFAALLRRRFFVLACLVTLIALFYAEENWRGHHAWEKYKRGLEAKGETVDLVKLAPPPVPDDQNFAMASIWVESMTAKFTNTSSRVRNWYGNKAVDLDPKKITDRLEMPVELSGRGLNFTNDNGDWQKAQETNLKEWQKYYRDLAAKTNFFPIAAQPHTPAEDVLLALSKYDSNIEELRAASERPYSRFPLGYTEENPAGILLPHLSVMRSSLYPLRLRAIAELKSEQSQKALDDLTLMFRLTDSIRNEPLLISQLVRIAMLKITIQPIWEGLAEHKWNDAQLAAIDSELGKLDFLADYQLGIRGERALATGCIDYLIAHPKDSIGAMGMSTAAEDFGNAITTLVPDGWFEQNKILICRMHTDYLLPIVDIESHTISMSAQRRASQAFYNLGKKITPYNWFARMLMPALEKAYKKFASAQGSADLARIACALERYRLAHGNFPESLDALAPQFLKTIPHDIIGGQPLKYRRTNDGQFILYSVGWNETDDGGQVVLSRGKTPGVDLQKGDWVWKYPAK